MLEIVKKILDFIYKKKCYFCSESKSNIIMCEKCYNKIELLNPYPIRTILDCEIYSASSYVKELQKLIRGIKYHNKKDLAFFQAKIMYEYFLILPNKIHNKKFIIVPTPMHKKRIQERHYNNLELVAEELAHFTGFEVNKNLIFRIKNTKPQYKLNFEQRQKNLENAFSVDVSKYQNKSILLIDDIFTTGTTVTEMIKELQKAGIKDITVFTTSTIPQNIV